MKALCPFRNLLPTFNDLTIVELGASDYNDALYVAMWQVLSSVLEKAPNHKALIHNKASYDQRYQSQIHNFLHSLIFSICAAGVSGEPLFR